MKKMCVKGIAISIAFIVTHTVAASGDWALFDDTDHSFIAENVAFSAIAPDGSIWYATPKGLMLYDGSQWKTGLNQELRGLRGMDIGPDGVVWVLLYNALMRIENGTAETFNANNSTFPATLQSRGIEVAPDGSVWVSVGDIGMIRYDGVHFTTYNTTNSPLKADDAPCCFAIGPDNIIWVIVENDDGVPVGLLQWYPGKSNGYHEFSNTVLDQHRDIRYLAPKGEDWLFLGLWNAGIAEYKEGKWIRYDHSNSDIPSHAVQQGSAWMTAMDAEHSSEGVWMGFQDKGLGRFHRGTWTIYDPPPSFGDWNTAFVKNIEYNPVSGNILVVFLDDQGNHSIGKLSLNATVIDHPGQRIIAGTHTHKRTHAALVNTIGTPSHIAGAYFSVLGRSTPNADGAKNILIKIGIPE